MSTRNDKAAQLMAERRYAEAKRAFEAQTELTWSDRLRYGLCCLFTGDRVRFLSLVNGEDAERDEIYRVIEQYFALDRLKIPPERVDSLLADFGAARRYEYAGAAAEAGRVVDRILASAAEIAVRLDRDGGADPEAFPMIEDCPPECRFYRFCRPS